MCRTSFLIRLEQLLLLLIFYVIGLLIIILLFITYVSCVIAIASCTQGDIRLAGGNSSSGRVEICHNNDLLEETQVVGVLRFATTTSGVQFVMTCGIMRMLKWPADNWVLALKVKT